MASRKLEDLVPEAQTHAKKVVEVCREVGVDILIYCTLRPLEEQARLFRQSRSRVEIDAKITKFRNRGFGYLAEVLDSVGPCYGRHVTNAAPGESWHNYGQAWDAVPLSGGKPLWNYMQATSEWNAYGECVRQVGMFWAGDWVSFREYPHAQLRPGSNPLKEYEPEAIHELLVTHKLLPA